MKLFVKIVLVLFLSFIAMPTIVSIVDKKVDTAYFFNTTEEEESLSTFNEIKMVYETESLLSNTLINTTLVKKFLLVDEDLECNFSFSILLPPPELI